MLVRGAGQRQTVFGPRFGANKAIGRSLRCRARSKLRREEVGGGLLRRWESLGPCRWQAAHPLRSVRLANPTQNTAPVILAEEEISDVSLATFYVFDKENTGAHRSGVQLAARGCGTEAAEAARPTQAAEAVPTQAAEAAPFTEAAVAARWRRLRRRMRRRLLYMDWARPGLLDCARSDADRSSDLHDGPSCHVWH